MFAAKLLLLLSKFRDGQCLKRHNHFSFLSTSLTLFLPISIGIITKGISLNSNLEQNGKKKRKEKTQTHKILVWSAKNEAFSFGFAFVFAVFSGRFTMFYSVYIFKSVERCLFSVNDATKMKTVQNRNNYVYVSRRQE